jgi:hypothetical protein
MTWKKMMASGVAIGTGPSGLMLTVQTKEEEEVGEEEVVEEEEKL